MHKEQHNQATLLLVGPFPGNGQNIGGVAIWNVRVVDEMARRGKQVMVIPWYGRAPGSAAGSIELKASMTGWMWSFRSLLAPANILLLGRYLWRGYLRSIKELYQFLRVFVYAAVATKRLDRSRPYVILSSHVGLRTVFALLLRRRLSRTQVVIDVHGVGAIETARTHGAFIRHLFGQADRVLVRSQFMKQRCLHAGAREADIEIIPCGIEVQPDAAMPEKKDWIIFCGALEERKDPMTLLRAVPLIRNNLREKVRVLFIGEGPLRAEMEAFIRKHHLERMVELTGPLPNEKVNEYLRAAKILVLPSTREPFGIVLIEALNAFTPCVITDVGGMPEIVDPQVGMTVPLGDHQAIAAAVVELFGDRSRWLQMARAARKKALRYDMQKIGDTLQSTLGL